ncbi:MAG TPA: hypothetical protein VG320_23590 [Paraburkholderia sp.]|jgi:hypothetical protein|uniref:hypothetical protein n=1 Tax=Paraburkholderia sp. TaxID=1926495 RepID=UPI002DF2544F|nr:hypothetical protein [Paraburkholderia sp.]
MRKTPTVRPDQPNHLKGQTAQHRHVTATGGPATRIYVVSPSILGPVTHRTNANVPAVKPEHSGADGAGDDAPTPAFFLSGKQIADAGRGHATPLPAASPQGESVMKKLLLIAATTLISLTAIQPAFAYDHHDCHKVKVHHHWETRCHH